jgi:RsiW-degrading membrane proteinase PrsW (M82 family)
MALVMLALSLIAVTVPTAIYVGVLYWFDRYEREPLSLLAVAFGWGAFPAVIFAIVGDLASEIPLSLLGNTAAKVVSASAAAPVVEEGIKGLMVLVLYWGFHKEFDGPLDGIVYGALIGAGFAMVENLLYLIGAFAEGGWASWATVLFLRTIIFGLNHAFFTSLTGLGFGLARLVKPKAARFILPLLGLGAAMFFHGVHNLGASLANLSCFTLLVSLVGDWGGVLAVLVVILLSLRQEKKWIVEELKEEVSAGLVSSEEYDLICSRRARTVAQSQANRMGNRAQARRIASLTRVATELAFKKHQARARGEDYAREIGGLRDQITQLRSEA